MWGATHITLVQYKSKSLKAVLTTRITAMQAVDHIYNPAPHLDLPPGTSSDRGSVFSDVILVCFLGSPAAKKPRGALKFSQGKVVINEKAQNVAKIWSWNSLLYLSCDARLHGLLSWASWCTLISRIIIHGRRSFVLGATFSLICSGSGTRLSIKASSRPQH